MCRQMCRQMQRQTNRNYYFFHIIKYQYANCTQYKAQSKHKHNRKSSETRVYSPVRRNAGKGFFQIFHKKVPVVPSMNDRMDLYVIDTSSDDGDDDDDTNNLTSDWLKKRSNNIINKKQKR